MANWGFPDTTRNYDSLNVRPTFSGFLSLGTLKSLKKPKSVKIEIPYQFFSSPDPNSSQKQIQKNPSCRLQLRKKWSYFHELFIEMSEI